MCIRDRFDTENAALEIYNKYSCVKIHVKKSTYNVNQIDRKIVNIKNSKPEIFFNWRQTIQPLYTDINKEII